jgi:hypothetical protein
MNKNMVYRAIWRYREYTIELGIYSTFENAYEKVVKDIVDNYDDEYFRKGAWFIKGYALDCDYSDDHRLQFGIYDEHAYYEHTPEYIYNLYGPKEKKK